MGTTKRVYRLHKILKEFIYFKLHEDIEEDTEDQKIKKKHLREDIKKKFCSVIVAEIKNTPETLNQKVIQKMTDVI